MSSPSVTTSTVPSGPTFCTKQQNFPRVHVQQHHRGAPSTSLKLAERRETREPKKTMDPVREAMINYWKHYKPDLESMMLDSNAHVLTMEEQCEILSYLPNFEGKDILELGAGIGRYTGIFGQKARRVLAVDFIQEFVDKNVQRNGHFTNVQFLRADVTELKQPNRSYDLIFINWLLMYLDDHEVASLVTRMTSWLKDGGHLFVRESCFHPSGKGIQRPSNNPTFYRDPSSYIQMLQTPWNREESTRYKSCLQLVRANSLQTYLKRKNNPNQLCFLMNKMTCPSNELIVSFQRFLDENQYTRKNIVKYEMMYGDSFVSPGGKITTQEFCKYLDLRPGQRVLDVGCGIGGSCFFMAKTYQVHVHGIDLSSNVISIALEKQIQQLSSNKVSFEIGDVTAAQYPDSTFDAIYSRDTILHVANKEKLLKNFLKWLKPGGRLLVSDYCRGDKDHHPEAFLKYLAKRGYHLLTIAEYEKLLIDVGFQLTAAQDRTPDFIRILNMELQQFHQRLQSTQELLARVDRDDVIGSWKAKLERCEEGDQTWGFFTAIKP